MLFLEKEMAEIEQPSPPPEESIQPLPPVKMRQHLTASRKRFNIEVARAHEVHSCQGYHILESLGFCLLS